MLENRIVVCLLISDGALVKTVRFQRPGYLGDPLNAVRIFNEFEVDELLFLDIGASARSTPIRFDLIREISEQCFMPLAYGGGITNLEQMRSLFQSGVEKVCLNSAALRTPSLIKEASRAFGSQSIVVSVDVKKDWLGRPRVWNQGKSTGRVPLDWCLEAEKAGAGEILLTSVERDGCWSGYDLPLVKHITESLRIPVVASGGAGSLQDLGQVISEAGASAAAAGSLFVYQRKGMGVLLSYPDRVQLQQHLLK